MQSLARERHSSTTATAELQRQLGQARGRAEALVSRSGQQWALRVGVGASLVLQVSAVRVGTEAASLCVHASLQLHSLATRPCTCLLHLILTLWPCLGAAGAALPRARLGAGAQRRLRGQAGEAPAGAPQGGTGWRAASRQQLCRHRRRGACRPCRWCCRQAGRMRFQAGGAEAAAGGGEQRALLQQRTWIACQVCSGSAVGRH
jgi:hypothetical protein